MPSNNFIIIVANSLAEALEKASNHFKKNKNELDYEILEDENKVKVKIFFDRKINPARFSEDNASADGYFKINYKDGYATLTVFPPKGKGIPVYIEEIINRMKILNIPKVNYDLLKEIMQNASCKPEILSDWPNGGDYRASVDVRINENKMSAYIILHKAKKEGAAITVNDIYSELKSYKINYGIDERLIEQMVLKNIYEKEVCIAEGKKVINEEGIKVKYYFDTDPGKPFLIDSFGRINLKELNFIQNKKKNDILAELIPPVQGQNGINIFGETVLYEKGKNVDLKTGKNAIFDETRLKIISQIDGNVTLKNDVVSVEPLVVVNNVNYETGNIDFDGSVLINGTIADGFSVKAGGIIQIGLSVGKVNIEAGSDVILKAGMNGNLEGKIECNGNIYARFIEGTNIDCKENLFVEEAVMNSNVKAGKNLMLVGRRSELIGGEATIGKSLKCKKIGNNSGVKTIVHLGIEPEKIKIIEDLKRKIEKNRDEIREISEKTDKLEIMRKSGYSDIDKIENSILNYKGLEIRLKDEIMIMEKDYKNAKKLCEPFKDSIVLAENTIFQGAEISFGDEELKVLNREKNKIILKLVNGKIKEIGYNQKESPNFEID